MLEHAGQPQKKGPLDVYVMQMVSKRATVALIIILKAYVICGAFLFRALERNNEAESIAKVKELYENITAELSSPTCSNSTRLLMAFHDFLKHSGQYSDLEGLKATQPKWNYEGAFFFSYTVVTTIGYGKLAPVTAIGRAACIVYALLGIPLFLTVLNQVSAYSHQCAVWLRIGTALHRHRICVVVFYVLLGVLLIYLPSVLIAREEGWTYHDSIYYVFITVFTVGFGDLVAGQKADAVPLYRYFLSIWFLLGIAYMTSIVKFLNGIDTKLVQCCTREVYIKMRKGTAAVQHGTPPPSAERQLTQKDDEQWAVKVQ